MLIGITSLVGTRNVDKAAIFNSEGTSAWASSTGFHVRWESPLHLAMGCGSKLRLVFFATDRGNRKVQAEMMV